MGGSMSSLLTDLVMSKEVVSVSPDADLASVFKKMKEHKFRHMPVVDKNNKLIGIISNRDLVEFGTGAVVRDYMSSPVATAAIDTPLGEVTQRMIDKKISALVVVKEKSVVGIITTEDLLRVLKVFLRSHSAPPESAFKFHHQTPIADVIWSLNEMGY
jgi:CBS domain-containing protein